MQGNCPSCKAEVVITPDNTESEWHPTASDLNSETPTPQSHRVATFEDKVDKKSHEAIQSGQELLPQTTAEKTHRN